MADNFFILNKNYDVSMIAFELQLQPELWNQDKERTGNEESPHRESDDIWVRYNDKRPFLKFNNFNGFGGVHFPVWYPAYYCLPSLRPLISYLMTKVEGEHLGGILLWRVKPGKQIYPHVDKSWHVDFYTKFNICIKGHDNSWFVWPDSQEALTCQTGDIYQFLNDTPHEVVNHSGEDLIMACICIRTHHYDERYIP